jgi:hypothetical protein
MAIYSDDQPDRPNKEPGGGEAQRYSISREMLIRMRDEDALLVRKTDMDRYIAEARSLESHTSNWVAAAWALICIATSLFVAAATVPDQFLLFGLSALFCVIGVFVCLVANRQVNRGRRDAAEKLAGEMERAPVDHVEIRPLRPDDLLPPPSSA